jgi:signal transduction histidine kinase/ligand-binding sensor domain-containing protein/response regulator RpfG family c-di-GMP phosphodiesterase
MLDVSRISAVVISDNPRFQNLTTRQGLSRSLVRQLVFDDFGFLWIATENGLNRYDGYRFTVFKTIPGDPNSIPDNNVLSLANLGSGGILAGLKNGKLARFDFNKSGFVEVKLPPELEMAFSACEPDYLTPDENGNVWISSTNGLFVWSPSTNEAWHFHPENSGLKTQYVKHAYFDRSGKLWLATDMGLARVDNWQQPAKARIHSYDASSLPSTYAKRVVQDIGGRIWLGHDGGLSLFDPVNETFMLHLRHQLDDINSLANNYIKDLKATSSGRYLWIGHDLGISLFDPVSLQFSNYTADPDNEHSLVNNYVKCVLIDAQERLWVGTDQGISIMDPEKEPFSSLVFKPGASTGLRGNVVYSIWEDQPKRVWLATNNGLHYWNMESGQTTVFRNEPDNPRSLQSNIVRAVMRDSRGWLWVGTDAGLHRMVETARDISFEHYAAGPPDGKHLSNTFVVTIREITDGTIWVGTWGGGINIFNPATLSFTYLTESSGEPQFRLNNNKIANIFEDSNGNIWLRSGNIYDKTSKTVKPFPFSPVPDNINFFYEDSKGRIWIGTTSNGLYYYDQQSSTLVQPQLDASLLAGTFASMLEDQDGNLWLTADSKLIRLNNDLTGYQAFDEAEGVLAGDFSNESVFRGSTGIFYFGGNRGVTWFRPEQVKLNTNPVRIWITAIYLDNKPVLPGTGSISDSAIMLKRSITLPFQHRDLVIEFTGINFTNSHKNKFAYRIEGLQDQWIELGADAQQIKFFRLPPGKHKLLLRAANSSGKWNNEPYTFEINVRFAWYQNWWVWLLAAMLLIGLVLLILQLRTKKLNKQKKLLEAKVMERTKQLELQKVEIELKNKQLQEASKAKSEFLANMSHEIRTPLNGIIGFTDLLLSTELTETQSEYLNIIHQSGENLLSIINDILDFSKIEAGKLELYIEKTDLIELSSQTIDIITFQAQSKELEVLLNLHPQLPRFIYTDSIRLKQVIVNLLSNAVKFTEKGEIELKVELLSPLKDQKALFRFLVRDTGIGINPEKVSIIFDAFTQEDSSTTKRFGGTGLGLAISNSLLGLMGSRLQLISKPGKGSTFFFDLELKCDSGAEEIMPGLGWVKKALIVDDNFNNRVILSKLLSELDIEVVEASSALDALKLLKTSSQFDVVFVDYHMPQTDGLELIEQLHQLEGFSFERTKVVLWHSSYDNRILAGNAEQLGVHLRMTKPITIQKLRETLHKLKTITTRPLTLKKPSRQFQGQFEIMLVEDNPVNMLLARTLVKKILPQANIIECNNGLIALNRCREQMPDLIFMDIQMPEMNGHEATRQIRQLPNGDLIPIIAITAGNIKGERERCLSIGMNDFLTKPVVEDALAESLAIWLKLDEKLTSQTHAGKEIHSITLDLELLRSELGNDPLFLKEFLLVLAENLEDTRSKFLEAIEKNDLDRMRSLAHKLKGTALSIRMNQLALQASEAEKIANLATADAQNLIQGMLHELENVGRQVHDELSKMP